MSMDTENMESQELTTRQKYMKTEAYKKSHAESKRKYYASHPEYREKLLILKQKYRRCEKELKTEFIRLSGILC